jgi:type IV/VI secretion system ImpK/VasF family protein
MWQSAAGRYSARPAGMAVSAMRLLECFSPLFSYGLQIDEQAAAHAVTDDLATVQARAQALLEQARTLALAEGKSLTDVEMAAFAVVAWFDEMVMRHDDAWDHAVPLQLALFHTGGAASEFFDHLAGLGSHADEVREVYSMALLLGFVGQYYYEDGDNGELGRIKALHCPTSVNAPTLLQSLQRDAITSQPYRAPGSPLMHLQAVWTGRPAPFVAGSLVLLVLLAFVAPALSSAMSTQAWYAVAVAMAIAGTLGWGVTVAWHELVRRRAHNRLATDPDAGYGVGELWAALVDAARHVRGAILHPFRRRRTWRRLARHPWLLFMGDSVANVRGLLRAAAHAPHAREFSGEALAKPWHWWVYRSLIAIEPGPHLMPTADGRRGDDAPWEPALDLLARERRKLPLDGIVLCAAAPSLLESAPSIETYAATLCGLAGEAASKMQLQLPFYIVLTGLDALPGYAAFRATLPSAVLHRALGMRVAAPSSTQDGWRMDVHLNGLCEQLRTTALAVLVAQRDEHGRREVFDFVQSLPGFQRGLQTFVERVLASEAVAARRLLWCGLYLTGDPQAGTSAGDFADDLFTRFLPGDWLLARRLAWG